MIELSKHIEILLLEHNCVIVPQLGGFIAQDVPARFVTEENLFLPPHRTVGFNPQLTLNDGLLVQSYMQAYDTNYPETVQLIEQAVTELKEEIQESGCFELNGIGKISLDIDGQYNFEPNEAGILSPSLYGLDSVVVKPLENKPLLQQTALASHSCNKEVNRNTKNYTFSINKELVNYVAAAVVAILFYFLWATPVTDTSAMSAQQASMLFPHHVQHIQNLPEFIPAESSCDTLAGATGILSAQQEEIAQAAAEPQVTAVPAATETSEAAPVKPAIANESAEPYYSIVLVSRVALKNAERFAEDLHAQGYNEACVLQRKGSVKVVYGKYASETEAHNELNKLRNQSSQFRDAWVLNVK